MQYGILGPLRILHPGGELKISARKIETVLTVLLLRAERVVPVSELLVEVWGGDPPRQAVAAMYVYVSQLRKLLSSIEGCTSEIITQSPGYLLRRNSDELDLDVFQRRIEVGRRRHREGRYAEAARCFQEALSLWSGRGTTAHHEGPLLSGFAIWMDEAALECTEMMIDSGLAAGQHRQLVARLHELTATYPLRESFHRQLMLALYRSERQADALTAYQRVRDSLRSDLGLEPGRRLQELQQAVLAGDHRLDLPTYQRTG